MPLTKATTSMLLRRTARSQTVGGYEEKIKANEGNLPDNRYKCK